MKQHLVPLAELLYVQNGYTYEEIELSLGVSKQTLSNWAGKYNWKEKREQYRTQPLAITQKIDVAFVDEFDTALIEGFTTTNVDKLCKLASMKSKYGGVDDFPGHAVLTMTDFTKFVIAHPKLTPEQKGLIHEVKQEYLNDVREREYGRQR